MKLKILVLFWIFSSLVAQAWQPPRTKQACSNYVDSALHVEFPSTIGGLDLTTRTVFERGDDDYSLRYDSADSRLRRPNGRHLDVIVYTYDREPMSDGINDKVLKEFNAIMRDIRLCGVRGTYFDVDWSGRFQEGRFPQCGLPYRWTSNTMKFDRQGPTCLSTTVLWSWRNHFIQVRHSEAMGDSKNLSTEVLSDTMLNILSSLDALIADAMRASKVDIYAIKDPAAALAALRRKWLGVEDCVSAYNMPDFENKYKELDRIQRWCMAKIDERAKYFLDVGKAGVELKIEPEVWYYNLACALARLHRTDDAFEALEQAIAAGYNDVEHAKKDADLDSLRNDRRLDRLYALAALIKDDWRKGAHWAHIEGGTLAVDDQNSYWGFDDHSYQVCVDNATSNTLIYLDRNAEHRPPPAENLVAVKYAEPFETLKRTTGPANFNFVDPRTDSWMPVLSVCTDSYRGNPTNAVLSVPARMWGNVQTLREATYHFGMNVLGIYSSSVDYAFDGVDRIFGWSPVMLVSYDDTPDELVRLCADAWQAMRPAVREKGGIRQVLGLIRRGQTCVKDEADVLSPDAQRPALSIENIDRNRVLALARNLKTPYPDIPFIDTARVSGSVTSATDLWDRKFSSLGFELTAHSAHIVAYWAEKTQKFEVGVWKNKGRHVWKVLQGDPSKIRIMPRESGTNDVETVEIACDYHEAFDVVLPGGVKMKSSRVDIGCFQVVDGVASAPALVSVFYPPAETRVYGTNGLLESIDYTRHQIPGWRPDFCPRGDFKDVFRWTDDGTCLGWMRTGSTGWRAEFARHGLVVRSRDRLGRPLDVGRSLRMCWMQYFNPFVTTGEAYENQCRQMASILNEVEARPSATILLWKYAYTNDQDRLGEPMPRELVRFQSRPERCTTADFSATSGFGLPLIRQLMLGEREYERWKFDLFDSASPSLGRRDDPRKAQTARKMQFCPWTPSTNDVWKLDVGEFEQAAVADLQEQPDGACRMRIEPEEKGGEPTYRSIDDTLSVLNFAAESYAHDQLEASYRRCEQNESRDIMAKCREGEGWTHALMSVGRAFRREDMGNDKRSVLSLWQMSKTLYFGIKADPKAEFSPRTYFYLVKDGKGDAKVLATFEEMPSRAIGNTVLEAENGRVEALNNLAVLIHAGVVRTSSDPALVVGDLLNRAARKGCATARRNLDVLNVK